MAAWMVFDGLHAAVPVWLRFTLAGSLFLFGPGAALTWPLLTHIAWGSRALLALGFGMAAAPTLAHVLHSAGRVTFYPFVSAALAGGALGYCYERQPAPAEQVQAKRLSVLLVAVLALAVGSFGVANRIDRNADRTIYYGDYDSYDLTYYAAIAAELTHTMPPASPFHAGRPLNHSFYPQVVPAMIHRFADVPLLDMYFRYIWPAGLLVTSLMCFLLVERIASTGAALVAAILLIVGSDLSYLAAWIVPRPRYWDDVVWSANFLNPGAETLLFNNYTVTLSVVFAALYALAIHEEEGRDRWLLIAGGCVAVVLLFKPFAYGPLMLGLTGASLASRHDRAALRRFLLVAVAALLLALPYLRRVFSLTSESPATLQMEAFVLPRLMLNRMQVYAASLDVLTALGVPGAVRAPLVGLLATPIFLVSGLGFRLFGVPVLWRCLRRPRTERPVWRILAWTTLAALATPFVVVAVPYYETMHFNQLALFLLPMFVGRAVAVLPNWKRRFAAGMAIIAIAVPSTAHYLKRRWSAEQHRQGLVQASDRSVIELLRSTDPEQTVILHHRPATANLIAIFAERRSVLAWGRYVRESNRLQRDIDRFFSRYGTPGDALTFLRQVRPSHVLVYRNDRTHPEALRALELVVETESVTLYAMPDLP